MKPNNAITFQFNDYSIRTVMRGNDPWFIAKDVCDVLEIDNSRDAITRLDDDEKGVVSTDTPGGAQDMTAINESGLYSMILGSRKPEAKAFKKWVTSEVLPEIRKTGSYQKPMTREQQILAELAEIRAGKVKSILADAFAPTAEYGSIAPNGLPRLGARRGTYVTARARLEEAEAINRQLRELDAIDANQGQLELWDAKPGDRNQ